MHRILSVFLTLAAAPAVAQEAPALPDGIYPCTISSYFLGDIEIAGGQYRGPAFDGNFEGSHPFTQDGPTLTWGGPLGGISEAGTIVSTVLKDAGGGAIGFDVTIQNKDSGNFQTISCGPAQ